MDDPKLPSAECLVCNANEQLLKCANCKVVWYA